MTKWIIALSALLAEFEKQRKTDGDFFLLHKKLGVRILIIETKHRWLFLSSERVVEVPILLIPRQRDSFHRCTTFNSRSIIGKKVAEHVSCFVIEIRYPMSDSFLLFKNWYALLHTFRSRSKKNKIPDPENCTLVENVNNS